MKITRATEYACRALRYLNTRIDDRCYSIQEIAEAEEVPVQFLAKVMQSLTQAGIVRSTCGKSGGYRIRRDPSEITLADVFTAVEGPFALNPCLDEDTPCSLREKCRVHDVWKELQDAMLEVLNKYTVNDVAPKQEDC
ncbi:MAG TPA: Rrf2 family transcriptional regulator [Myxococcota bacterium]|nr:Rrf2 family transcriptional regulator [Myxococcota bacterium]HOA14390.1 Rrf2 family transcriptional regulator [Myxococcota bacterium]HOC98362.1 Rrf2 family transcriptional regulator [Myxococcota bacterium]HOH77866.1 Rrf2 family transcriptional regulator [Myxococcota bacterium]HPV04367.1 Rrf2 family transcriptional regulator [Myxococcota bacterium]